MTDDQLDQAAKQIHYDMGCTITAARLTARRVALVLLPIEREKCAKVADAWLESFGKVEPTIVDAKTWACDAIRDIAQNIRSIGNT